LQCRPEEKRFAAKNAQNLKKRKYCPQMNALKCKEHFERTLVRPVGRSAGLREVNERKDKQQLNKVFICVHLWKNISLFFFEIK